MLVRNNIETVFYFHEPLVLYFNLKNISKIWISGVYCTVHVSVYVTYIISSWFWSTLFRVEIYNSYFNSTGSFNCNPCQANKVKKQDSCPVLLIGPYLYITGSFWKFAL